MRRLIDGARVYLHPMAREHLPMIRRWLETPEVVRWWGDPDEQYALVSGIKAGFQSEGMIDTPDGPALMMVRNP